MKKILYTLIIFMMFLTVTNAAKCNVISGTGKNIGDEVACGTEHFYVIENDGKQVKMLSKYNLYAGTTQEKISINTKDYTTSEEYYNLKEVKKRIDEGFLVPIISKGDKDEIKTTLIYKPLYTELKSIFFEKENMTFHEFLNRKDVQNMFDQGYSVEYTNIYAENKKCSVESGCTYDYFGGMFEKPKYYESKVIVFEEPYYTDDTIEDIEEYLKQYEEYKKLLDDGYSVQETYYVSFNSSTDQTVKMKYIYSGVELVKPYENFKDSVYQSEKALGAVGDENRNIDQLEVGLFLPMHHLKGDQLGEEYSNYYYDYTYLKDEYNPIEPYYFGVKYYLDTYHSTLKDKGYNVFSTDSPTISELNKAVKDLTEKELPLIEWYENVDELKNNQYISKPVILGSIKELVPKKYSWLWGTTYWLRTADENWNYFFVDTMGDICTLNWCTIGYGAGIRPVITLSSNDLVFNVKTKTDGNGTIESTHVEAGKGETVKFTIKPNEGYVLKEVKVTDASGNVVKFTDYTFTMPEANVLIEATFKTDNPDTSTSNIMVATLLLILSLIIFYKYKKKAKWIE